MPWVICKKTSFFNQGLLFHKCIEGTKEKKRWRDDGREEGNKGERWQRGREEAREREGRRKDSREKHLPTATNSISKLFLSPGSQQ